MTIRTKAFLFIFIGFSFSLFGQNELSVRYYMLNPQLNNGAWLGQNDQPYISGHYRGQWLGYQSTFDNKGSVPSEQVFSVAFPIASFVSGVGFVARNSQKGLFNQTKLTFSGATSREFDFGKVAFGLSPSLIFQSVQSGFRAVDNPDDLIPTEGVNAFNPNLGVSIFFQFNKDFFVGLAFDNALEPSFSLTSVGDNKFKRLYTLYGGTNWNITNEFSLKPTFLVKSNVSVSFINLSLLGTYKNKFFGGISYSALEAIGLLVGASFLKNNELNVGYSLDYITNERGSKEPTSHELFVRYNLNKFSIGGKKSVKTPRFTY